MRSADTSRQEESSSTHNFKEAVEIFYGFVGADEG
jgi:hypothetical protein